MDISFITEVTQPSSEETIVLSINGTQSIDHPVGKIKIDLYSYLLNIKGKTIKHSEDINGRELHVLEVKEDILDSTYK